MKIKSILMLAACAAIATGCKTPSETASSSAPASGTSSRDDGGVASYMPQAVAYRTSVDVANLVPVTLNDARTKVVSYPAPSDITSDSTPLALGEGWYLDRRGISPNTAFTNWTYPQYAKLAAAPSAEQIMANLAPGAYITEIAALPFRAGEAGMREAITALRQGNYKVVYTAPARK